MFPHDSVKNSEANPEWMVLTSNPDMQLFDSNAEEIRRLTNNNDKSYTNPIKLPPAKIPETSSEWLRFASIPGTQALQANPEVLRSLAHTDKLPPPCLGVSRPRSARRPRTRDIQDCGVAPNPLTQRARLPSLSPESVHLVSVLSVNGDPQPDVPSPPDKHCIHHHPAACQEDHSSLPCCHGQQPLISKGSLAIPPTVSSCGTFLQPPPFDIRPSTASISLSPLPSLHSTLTLLPTRPQHPLRSSSAVPATISSHSISPQPPSLNIEPSTASASPPRLTHPEHVQDLQHIKPQPPVETQLRVSLPLPPAVSSCSAFLQLPALARPQSPSLASQATLPTLYPSLKLLQAPQNSGHHPASPSPLSSILPPIHPAPASLPAPSYRPHQPVTSLKNTWEMNFYKARDVIFQDFPESVRYEEPLPVARVARLPGLPHTPRHSAGKRGQE